MNNVASEDAMVYANANPDKPLDVKRKRIVVAKKQQIKKSSKKANRRINNSLLIIHFYLTSGSLCKKIICKRNYNTYTANFSDLV